MASYPQESCLIPQTDAAAWRPPAKGGGMARGRDHLQAPPQAAENTDYAAFLGEFEQIAAVRLGAAPWEEG